MRKNDLLTLVGNDDLDGVLKALLAYAQRHASGDLRSDALIQAGHLEAYKKASRAGTASFEQLAQQRASVRQALLELVNELPEQPPGQAGKGRRPGMSEWLFKRLLFWGMLSGKGAVVSWLLLQGDTGGLSAQEVGVTITLLLPVFTAYFMAMLNDFLKNRYISSLADAPPPRRVRWTIPAVTLLILVVYFGLMLYFIHQRALGTGDLGGGDAAAVVEESKRLFENMTARLMLLETAIGIYVGMIIDTFFERRTTAPSES
ncbi:MAG: hypothetical protein SFV52_01740 [Saprospiraceae bacterium]|nr:hypothetical protein [Saprospiraceae bacterium]